MELQANERELSNKILIIGRVHPGEPNGSLIMQTMLEILNNPKNNKTNRTNYLIVPIINVDGVVNGNFRTSFSGKDLNRRYGKNDPLCPELQYLTGLMNSNILIGTVDLHGHSSKQNIFVYGGGFVNYHNEEMEQLNKSREFYECRLFVNNLQKFQAVNNVEGCFNKRACMFGLSNGKYSSCRGYFYR